MANETDIFDGLLEDDHTLSTDDLQSEGVAGDDNTGTKPFEIEGQNQPIVQDAPEFNPLDDEDEENDEENEGEGDEEDNQPEEGEIIEVQPNDLINQFLAAKGIKDAMVQYEDEDGNLQEVDFYSLPPEEQLAIMNSNDSDINYGLSENEINTVNFLRNNNITLEEAREYFRREAVQEYIDSQNITGIETDQYSDEELFAIDLAAKYGLSEEDIEIELQKQQEHPELFKKKVDKLRADYKEIEEQQREQARLADQEEAEAQVRELQENLVSVANEIEDIGGLEVEIQDKNDILNYILEKDINGVSPFLKNLDSPKQLFEMAWFALKGKQAFDVIHDYYRKEIDKVNKTAYAKGKEDATRTSAPSKQSGKVFKRAQGAKPASNNSKPEYPSMDDILLHLND